MITGASAQFQNSKDSRVHFTMTESPTMLAHALNIHVWQNGNPSGDLEEQVSSSADFRFLFSEGQVRKLYAVLDAYLQELALIQDPENAAMIAEVSSDKFAGLGISLNEPIEEEEVGSVDTGC